ncbi:MAG: prepilin peptidase [Planctomycetes bacterium]|nr:prepilin peptidase [Planctomycetota bacterium]
MSATAVFEVGAALLGACVGSFLNVVIWRLPQADPRQRSLGGRSRCPRCGVAILWRDNVPILGWLLRRGRARCCGAPIAARYPLVEGLTAALFLALAIWPPLGRHVLQPAADGGLGIDAAAAAAFALHATFLALLVACTFIDFDTQLLPDALTKPGMAIGLLGGFWPGLAGVLTHDDAAPVALRSLLASVCGLLAGSGSTWLVRALGGWFFRREAMGLGDVKFLGMVGAFLGWQGALLTLFLGCVAGAVIGSASMLRAGLGTRIPFGPYLALGAVVSLFAAEPILDLLFVRWPEWQRSSPTAQWFLLAVALLSLSGLFLLVRKARRTS